MYKNLLVSTLLLSLSCNVLGEVKIYGKANVSFQLADEGESSKTEVVSNASRLGVRGGEAVNDDLEVVYQFEYEVAVDDGDNKGQTLTQRNIFLGLKGGFGTLLGGKFDTPLKKAQKKVDLFNDLEGDIKNMLTVNDNRSSNILSYTTPTKATPFSATVAYISSEDEDVDDGKSLSLAYEREGLYLALAFDQDVEAEDVDVVRLVAQYKYGNFQFGGLYEDADTGGNQEADAWMLSGKYAVSSDWALKVQFGESDIVRQGTEYLSLGADYKLAKNLKAFGYFTTYSSDSSGGDVDNDYLGTGLEYKF